MTPSARAMLPTEMAYPIEGGCLCRTVRFRIDSAPIKSGYCHCRYCQLNSGAPVVADIEVPIAFFAYTAGTPGIFRSSSWGQREFCAGCGSFLAYRDQQAPASISINTASLDDPASFPPTQHVFASRRIPWFDTADDLPRHAEWAPADG